jgi:hypothetical protein
MGDEPQEQDGLGSRRMSLRLRISDCAAGSIWERGEEDLDALLGAEEFSSDDEKDSPKAGKRKVGRETARLQKSCLRRPIQIEVTGCRV